MKNLPFKFLAILIFSAVFTLASPPESYAESIDENGITWYTIPELLEYREEAKNEARELCGSELICLQNLHAERMANDPKYEALSIIESYRFVITAFGPETIKMIFFNEEPATRGLAPDRLNDLEIKYTYVGWFDGYKERNALDQFLGKQNDFFNDNIPGVHLIFGKREVTDGVNWFINKNREMEFPVSLNSNITEDKIKLISYKVSTNRFNMSGSIGYSSCSQVENYDETKGCTAKFSTEKGLQFFGVSKAPEESNEDILPTDEPTNSEEPTEGSEINDDYQSSEENRPTKNESTFEKIQTQSENKLTTIQNVTPKAPETGAVTYPCNQKTIEFPWWLVIVIALADAAVLWLFWPRGKKV